MGKRDNNMGIRVERTRLGTGATKGQLPSEEINFNQRKTCSLLKKMLQEPDTTGASLHLWGMSRGNKVLVLSRLQLFASVNTNATPFG